MGIENTTDILTNSNPLSSPHSVKRTVITSTIGISVSLLIVGLGMLIGYLYSQNALTQKVLPTSAAHNAQLSPTQVANTRTSLIDTNTYHFNVTSELDLTTIQMTGKGSQGLAIDSNTGDVYVGAYSGINNECLQGNNNGTSFLDVVNPALGKQIASTKADTAPIWPAVDDQRGLVYLASSSGEVGVYDLNTGTKEKDFSIGGLPHMPAVLGGVMVVSNTYNTSQTYFTTINLDSGTVIGNFQGPPLPHPIIIDPSTKTAYMMSVSTGEIQVIDMTNGTPKSTFTLPGGAGQLAMSSKYNLFITDANSGGDSISFFNMTTHQFIGSAGFSGIGTPGTVLATDDTSGLLFVVLQDKNAIGVVSLQTMKPLGYFTVGGCPYAVRIDSQRGYGYVTNSGDGTLTKFSLSNLEKAL